MGAVARPYKGEAIITVGQIVISKCGRDKNMPFIVTQCSEEYLYLVDGALRTMNKPKKKKKRHVQATNTVAGTIVEGLRAGSLNDAAFRRALETFRRTEKGDELVQE